MKLNHLSLALVPLFGLASFSAVADGPPAGPHKEVIVIADAASGEREIVDVADLEVGESRSLSTADGKPVVITREEKGWEIEVDGEKTSIAMLHDGDMPDLPEMPEGAGRTRILVEKRHHGDAKQTYAYVMSDSMDDAQLETRIEEILKGVEDSESVVIHRGDGEHKMKVIKVIENGDGTKIETGDDRQVVIVRKHVEKTEDEKPQD